MPPTLLFAYGALTDPSALARRGMAPAAPPRAAAAPAHALAFCHRGGYATLVPVEAIAKRRGWADSPCVRAPARGVLLSLASRSDLDARAAREGGSRLDTVAIVLLGEGGGGAEAATAAPLSPSLTAHAFVSRAGLTTATPLPPRAAYLAKLAAGAAAAGLGDEWGAWLARVPTLADGGALPAAYSDTVAGRAAAAVATGALLAACAVAAGAGG